MLDSSLAQSNIDDEYIYGPAAPGSRRLLERMAFQFGRFYNQSYLSLHRRQRERELATKMDGTGDELDGTDALGESSQSSQRNSCYLKYPPLTASDKPKRLTDKTHFHVPPGDVKTRRRGRREPIHKGTISDKGEESGADSCTVAEEDPRKLAHFASGTVPPPDVPLKIERLDWPAPPSMSSSLAERHRRRRHRSGPQSSGATASGAGADAKRPAAATGDSAVLPQGEGGGTTTAGEETELEGNVTDPGEWMTEHRTRFTSARPRTAERWARDIKYLQNIRESAMAREIFQDMERERDQSPPLDPRSSSRVPSASHEPSASTRYISSMFASPSRFTDRPPLRRWSRRNVIDQDRGNTDPGPSRSHYQLLPQRIGSPAKPNTVKPGYTRGGLCIGTEKIKKKSSTLPINAQGLPPRSQSAGKRSQARENKENTSDDLQAPKASRVNGHSSSAFHRSALELSHLDSQTFRMEYYGLKPASQGSFLQSYAYVNKPALASLKSPRKIYELSFLRSAARPDGGGAVLPKDVDRAHLEAHLSDKDFADVFQMGRREFYQQPVWRQNEAKQRNGLL